jgi:hypothetical protein
VSVELDYYVRKILEGNILEMSDDGKEIFNAYRRYKKKGDERIVFPAQNGFRIFKEDVPPGILK